MAQIETLDRPRPPSSLLRRLGVLAASLALTCVLAEWSFRGLVAAGLVECDIWPFVPVDFKSAIHRYSEDPELVYECRPNARSDKDGVPILINSAGFRGGEFPLQPTAGVPRIAVLGDSVAFAVEVPVEETFPYILEQDSRAGPGPLEVLNFGVTGYNSDQERRLLDTRVLAYRPDVLVLAYVQNDVTPADGLGAMCRAAHPSMLGRRLHSRLLIFVQHRLDKRAFWANRSFRRPEMLFDRLSDLDREGTSRGLVVLFPQLNDARDGWNRPDEYDRARDAASARGLTILDLRACWAESSPLEIQALYADRTHLAAPGHRQVARLLRERIQTLLAQ